MANSAAGLRPARGLATELGGVADGGAKRAPGRATARNQSAVRTAPGSGRATPVTAADFPGCLARPMGLGELAAHQDPLEYWDACSQTAFVQASPDAPRARRVLAERFAALGAILAAARGSLIATATAPRLLWRDRAGVLAGVAQADAAARLHPHPQPPRRAGFSRAGGAAVAEAGGLEGAERAADALPWPPDIVLDVYALVRPRKLALYAALGVAEVWAARPSMPPEPVGSAEAGRGLRPARQRGLAIHVLNAAGDYAPARASAAIPGWSAAEIDAALHDAVLSWATTDSLRRLGRALAAAGDPQAQALGRAGQPRQTSRRCEHGRRGKA